MGSKTLVLRFEQIITRGRCGVKNGDGTYHLCKMGIRFVIPDERRFENQTKLFISVCSAMED